MSLKDKLQQDMKAAMRAGEKRQLAVIRLINAAIKQREVDERIELDDEQVTAAIDKMAKQRRESIEQYEKAGRDDLADQEKFELELLNSYLPEQLGEAEIEAAVTATGASSIKDMGKIMGQLKPKLAGRADMGAVSGKIKARLS